MKSRILHLVALLLIIVPMLPMGTLQHADVQAQENDSIHNLRIVSDTHDSLTIEVDYTYNSEHGDNVWIGAHCLHEGSKTSWMGYIPQRISRGDGSATVVMDLYQPANPPDRSTTDQIEVLMYTSENTFYTQVFDYFKTWSLTPDPTPPPTDTSRLGAPVITFTDSSVAPDTLTVSVGITLTIVNASSSKRTVEIGNVAPTEVITPTPTITPTPDTGPTNEKTVFLPLIVRSNTAQARNQAFLPVATPQLQHLAATPVASTPSQETGLAATEQIMLDSGEQRDYIFSATGVWYVYNKDDVQQVSTVNVVDPAPTTYPLTVQLAMNDQAAVDLHKEAVSDPNSTDLTFSITAQPQHGAVVIASGVLTYTPTLDYTGADSLTYTVDDGANAPVEGTINFDVLAPTKPPIAGDRVITIAKGDTTTVDLGDLVKHTQDASLTYAVDLDGNYGLASIEGNTLTYQQTIDLASTETFTDSVTYAVSNDQNQPAYGTVIIRIVSGAMALTANDSMVSLYTGDSATVDLTTLVDNPAGDALTFALETTIPVSGVVKLQGNNLTFTPESGYLGITGFVYSVSNSQGQRDTGQVLFDVQPPLAPAPVVDTQRPTQLVIEPAQAMFTHVGETRGFTLLAYNTIGEQVPLDTNDIVWDVVNQDTAQALHVTVDPQNTTHVTVTAQANVGYAQLKASWGGITSRSATITVVELQPGVVVVPDSAVRERVTNTLPPELAALPTRSERVAWLEAQGTDYTLPMQFRAVIDTDQVGQQLQTGDLVVPSGIQPVYGKIIKTDTVESGTEIIYETVPITDTIISAQLKAEYGPEDMFLEGEELIVPTSVLNPTPPDLSLNTSGASLTAEGDGEAEEPFHFDETIPLIPKKLTFPCGIEKGKKESTKSMGLVTKKYVDDNLTSTKRMKASSKKSSTHLSCGATIQMTGKFQLTIDLDKRPESFRFATSAVLEKSFTVEFVALLGGEVKTELDATAELSIPVPGLNAAIVGTSIEFAFGPKATFSASGGIELKLAKTVSFQAQAGWVFPNAPTGSLSKSGFNTQLDEKN